MAKKDKNQDIHDSTTDFFLDIMKKEDDDKEEKKEKEKNPKDLKKNSFKTLDRASKLYNYINKAVDKILSNQRNIFLISVLLTLVLFFVISGGNFLSSPTSGATLENVKIDVNGLNEEYEISGIPDSVTIGLIGPSLDIYSAQISNDYEVYIDVSGYEPGNYSIDLVSRNFPSSLTVMLIPNSVDITISKKVESVFKLDYRFTNEDEFNDEYSVSLESLSQNNVSVYASKDTISKIASVEACIDVSNQTSDFTYDAPVKAFDASGNELDVEITPETVRVSCKVSSYSKDVPINPQFVGEVASGYAIKSFSLSTNTVRIYGDEEQLNKISEVMCEVDISDLQSSSSISNVALIKAEGIDKLSIDSVTVDIEIEHSITQKFEKVEIKVLNQPSDVKVSFVGNSQSVTLSVTGAESIVSTITADNIEATIDIDGLDVGSQKVKVSVAIDNDNLDVKLLSSEYITIDIERK